jgi:hypothetical protein
MGIKRATIASEEKLFSSAVQGISTYHRVAQ